MCPWTPLSGRHIVRSLTGSSLNPFHLLYCKYLIPPRCPFAISGRINRRGARQKGHNEFHRLSDTMLPDFTLYLSVLAKHSVNIYLPGPSVSKERLGSHWPIAPPGYRSDIKIQRLSKKTAATVIVTWPVSAEPKEPSLSIYLYFLLVVLADCAVYLQK